MYMFSGTDPAIGPSHMTGMALAERTTAGTRPSAAEVRRAIESLGDAVHNAVAAGSREQADAAMVQVNDVLAMVEQSPDFSPEYRASIVNAVRSALANMPAQSDAGPPGGDVPAPEAPAA